MASPTGRGVPADGSRCMRRPGAALTSTMTPPCSSSGSADVRGHHVDAGDVQSDDLGGLDGAGGDLGMDPSVTSVAVPPVLRLALRRISTIVPAGGIESGRRPCSASTASAMASS